MAARQPIESALGVLVVLEALKDHAVQPIKAATVAQKANRTDDFTRRALITLKEAGWAVETERGWLLSVKAGQFSENWIALASNLTRLPTCPKCQISFPWTVKDAQNSA